MKLLSILTLLAAASMLPPVSAASAAPNLVLIIADDMNWDDCGVYGHPAIRTPHIDRLAAEGMKFQHAYLTTNSCSPSRSSILTGKYPHNTGAEQLHWPLPAGSQTFAQLLKTQGYYTAAAGKWHLGNAVRDHFDKIYEASDDGFVLPSGKAGGAPARMIAKEPSGCEHPAVQYLATLYGAVRAGHSARVTDDVKRITGLQVMAQRLRHPRHTVSRHPQLVEEDSL
jgi:arylsulfatase A-like enzyme